MKRVESRNMPLCNESYLPKGPVIGPLVVAGVSIQDEASLVKLSVSDSKKVAPKRRGYLADQIKQIASGYEIISIPAADIDAMRKVMTLNELEVHVFCRVIEKLKPETCYVDSADVNEQRFGDDILAGLSFKPIIISRHKADERYQIVSAASILAKTTRDAHVRTIAQELGKQLPLPLGSGYPADPKTQTFLKTWIKQYGSLPPYTRQSWKTARLLMQQSKMKKLDDF